jgi:hypothetical protein
VLSAGVVVVFAALAVLFGSVAGSAFEVDGDEKGELLVVVWLGVVTVRLERSNIENDPPESKVMMMPAMTATKATPMSRSGQLRLIQSILFL